MRKKIAFIFALLMTGLIANTVYLFSQSQEQTKQEILVARVIDGDTLVDAEGRIIRLANINAPEKGTPAAAYAKEFLSAYTNKTIGLEILGTEKYGRLLGKLYAERYINLEIVEKGFASKFLVADAEKKVFADAEEEAISTEQGIWKQSSHASCLALLVDSKKEQAVLTNTCEAINLTGWILKDESRKQYKFHTLLKHELTIESTSGNDNETQVFWNAGNVWNDDRDTAYLFDADNRLAAHYRYGY